MLTFAEAVMLYEGAGKDATYLVPLVRHFRDTLLKNINGGTIRSAARVLYPNCSPATWNRQVITPTRAVINHAAENGLGNHIRVKSFPELAPVRRAVDRDWLDKFTKNVEPRIGALELLMHCTGARLGQAIALDWSKVDLARAEAIIPSAKRYPERLAHLTPEVVASLANLKSRKGRVFGYEHRWSVYKPWKRACKAANIIYVPPHQAGRHTFATEMIVRNNRDARTTAELGGWKSVKLLLDRYVHPENAKGTINAVFGTKSSQSLPPNSPRHVNSKEKS
jgi:integrase